MRQSFMVSAQAGDVLRKFVMWRLIAHWAGGTQDASAPYVRALRRLLQKFKERDEKQMEVQSVYVVGEDTSLLNARGVVHPQMRVRSWRRQKMSW